MKLTGAIATIGVSILPIIGVLILLWSDVQTIKVTKAEYREVAELKVEMSKQLSRNTEAIDNLNRTLTRIMEVEHVK